MGVVCALKEAFAFKYRAEVGDGLVENEYDHVFIGHWNGEPEICLDEVSDWAWWSRKSLLHELEEDPEKFTYWLRDCLGKVLSHPAARAASSNP
jgi:isopentenyl-diphosphate delta-isomerase